ncbi:MAG: hypothetical protein C6I05_03710 [Epsilonproteobacteria bacterium]|nr:hypothetical protein [Campylobacterota bacterium]
MDSTIIAFLEENHIFSLAVRGRGTVYAATCFYLFDRREEALIFASDPSTYHMELSAEEPEVAGTIHNCSRTLHSIRGVQFRGVVERGDERERNLYLEAFPVALLLNPTIWSLRLHWIKMTDNTLGFGRKIIWTRQSDR